MSLVSIIIVICICSIIQSVLGVGLLVFGTPILVGLGLPLDVTLGTVLPSSVALSFFQINFKKKLDIHKLTFIKFALPSCTIGLVFFLYLNPTWNLKLILGILLGISTILRLLKKSKEKLKTILLKYKVIYLAIVGLIHGVSNLGGGLIALYSSFCFTDKKQMREIVAFAYLILGIFQIIVLSIYRPHIFSLYNLLYPVISIFVYFTVGRRFFHLSSDKFFDYLMTFLMASFSILMIVGV